MTGSDEIAPPDGRWPAGHADQRRRAPTTASSIRSAGCRPWANARIGRRRATTRCRRCRRSSRSSWSSACSAFVVAAVHPELVLRNTTPTGGDMGAHVWGPDYLLHHLLPKLRLSGWTPDWYDGFPAYQFYMVVPSLLVVVLNVGISGLLAVPAAMVAAAVAASGWCTSRLYRWRRDPARRRARRARAGHPDPVQRRLQAGHGQRAGQPAHRRLGLRPAVPTCRSRSRRCARSRPCSSSSTGSRSSTATATSSAGTWRRRWRASSPSRSA